MLLTALAIAMVACNEGSNNRSGTNTKADNTGINVRDRSDTLTPENQSENSADRTITQDVRKSLMNDDGLSTNAKNIKIITVYRVVTLRGPVNSDAEKSRIEKKVKQVKGVERVDNQLDVVSTNRAP